MSKADTSPERLVEIKREYEESSGADAPYTVVRDLLAMFEAEGVELLLLRQQLHERNERIRAQEEAAVELMTEKDLAYFALNTKCVKLEERVKELTQQLHDQRGQHE